MTPSLPNPPPPFQKNNPVWCIDSNNMKHEEDNNPIVIDEQSMLFSLHGRRGQVQMNVLFVGK